MPVFIMCFSVDYMQSCAALYVLRGDSLAKSSFIKVCEFWYGKIKFRVFYSYIQNCALLSLSAVKKTSFPSHLSPAAGFCPDLSVLVQFRISVLTVCFWPYSSWLNLWTLWKPWVCMNENEDWNGAEKLLQCLHKCAY